MASVQSVATVRDAALNLSKEDRLELIAELLDSVEGEPAAEWERAWVEEVEKRSAAARAAGKPQAPLAEVRARLLARFP